jgi:catechol 2,3-dioxygenase-like lactoylglutathione lyase family enzyme
MQVSALDHIVLKVADVAEALRFYTEVLGMEPVRLDRWRAGEVPFPSVRVNAGTIIDLVPVDEPADRSPARANLDHFCLVIDGELAPALAELERHGVAIERGPGVRFGARGDGRSAYVRDPAGNLIELRTYAEPTSSP